MLRNKSFVYSGATNSPLTSASLFDVVVSLIPVLALALSWTSRLFFDRKAAVRDAAAVAAISSIWDRRLLYQFISNALSNNSILVYLATSVGILFTITVLQDGSLAEWIGASQGTAKESLQLNLPPLMIPCRTTHTRLFPAKHSFSYSYLFVGIPVGWTGRASTVLSADRHCRPLQEDRRKTWFSVEAEDYLERGTNPDGLRGKLFAYLRNQGVAPEQYSHALLVTAPRFLGFSFNPVSFWYLYNESNLLEAMVVEVNNTFDERRMYFMQRTTDGATTPKEAERHFNHSWEKDFHVSPFNSRDGLYSLQARDPYATADAGSVSIDCNIVLKTMDQKTKIVARVFSTESATDAMSMTRWQIWVFVFRWWWVGLMTNPRILREARILWVKNLQVYYRPEVMKTSIGRHESHEEAQLEPCFHLLLERLVECSQDGLLLSYFPAAGPRRGIQETIRFSGSDSAHHSRRRIEIRVLTPAFYSQFVRFHNHREAFSKLCFDAQDLEKLVSISDRTAFLELLSEIEQIVLETAVPLRWHVLAWLRGKPLMYSAPCLTAMGYAKAANRCVRTLSPLDMLILKNGNRITRRQYRRNVTALLISDHLAIGSLQVLRFYGVVIWAFLVYIATSCGQKLLRARPAGETADTFLVMLGILGPHLWATGSRLI